MLYIFLYAYVYVFVLIIHGSKCTILTHLQFFTSPILLILSKDPILHHNYVSGYHQEITNLSRANDADSQSYLCTRVTAEDVRDEQRDHCHPLLPSPAEILTDNTTQRSLDVRTLIH